MLRTNLHSKGILIRLQNTESIGVPQRIASFFDDIHGIDPFAGRDLGIFVAKDQCHAVFRHRGFCTLVIPGILFGAGLPADGIFQRILQMPFHRFMSEHILHQSRIRREGSVLYDVHDMDRIREGILAKTGVKHLVTGSGKSSAVKHIR